MNKEAERFAKITSDLGIPNTYAIDYYAKKLSKRRTSDIIADLAEVLTLDPKEVKEKFDQAWSDFVSISPGKNQESFLDTALKNLDTAIGKVPPYKVPISKNTGKVLITSDFHCPFVSPYVLNRILAEDADEVYILGDLFDMYNASRHRKITSITMKEELASATAVLSKLAAKFPKIKILPEGNHDVRAYRKLQELCPEFLPLVVNPVTLVAANFPNIEILSYEVPDMSLNGSCNPDSEPFKLGYLYHQNNFLLSHMENFYGGQVLDKLDGWLEDFEMIIPKAKIDIVFHAHSHRLGATYTHKNKLFVSTGCACELMPYIFVEGGKFSPPVGGFVIVEKDVKENFIPESVRLININTNGKSL